MAPIFDNIAARLVTPLMLLMVLGMAYTLASTVWNLVAPPEAAPLEPRQAVQQTGGRGPSVDMEAILNANLFGAASAATAPEPSETLAETRLPLVLHGVFVARTPERSTAILARRDRSGELFHIGDRVPGNATLEAVYLDHVQLRRGGIREKLAFPEPDQELATPIGQVESAQAPGRDRGAPPVQGGSPPSPKPARRGSEAESPAMMARQYQEKLRSDPQGALRELGLTPMNRDGLAGYRLDRLAQSPYLRQTGLKPGDVILSINGQPLGDVGRDRLELDNVLAEGSARLEVQRGERRFFVTASLN